MNSRIRHPAALALAAAVLDIAHQKPRRGWYKLRKQDAVKRRRNHGTGGQGGKRK